jgi:uncharacterized protein (TIGR02145 family)
MPKTPLMILSLLILCCTITIYSYYTISRYKNNEFQPSEININANYPHTNMLTMQSWNECTNLDSIDKIDARNCVLRSTQTYIACDGFIQGPTLVDERDGKSYQIRKFADDKCWMVDNLAYGGGLDGQSDYCSGKTGFRYADSTTDAQPVATKPTQGGLNPPDGSRNLYIGDCRDPNVDNEYCQSEKNQNQCGYLYNLVAAIQDERAFDNNDFDPHWEIPGHVQGLCPDGWHIPDGRSATTGNEFVTLDIATNGTSTTRTIDPNSFWGTFGSWQATYAGYADGDGTLKNQGVYGNYWSSSQYHAFPDAEKLLIHPTYIYPIDFYCKKNGFSIRCIKD